MKYEQVPVTKTKVNSGKKKKKQESGKFKKESCRKIRRWRNEKSRK